MTNSNPLPLEGIRIIDMSWMWAGPYCTLQLAHMGAEVIRIETHHRPCMNRRVPPYANNEPGLNRAGSFNQWNQGKRSLLLDLKKPEAQQIARDLVALSDVFVENYAAGVVDRLGLGWKALNAVNPRLIMASLSGYGLTGPYRERVAFGGPLTMISGLAELTGYIDHGPSEVGISYGDPNAALHGAFAVLAALWKREQTNRGQHIDLSQWESLIAILPEGVLPLTMRGEQTPRMANRDPCMAPHGIYRAQGDDRWVSIAIRTDDEWQRFAALLDADLPNDRRFTTAAQRKAHEDQLDAIIVAWAATQEREAIVDTLQGIALAAVPVMDMKDVAEDPHMNGRGFFVELDHPEIGKQKHAGIPWKFHGTPLAVRRPAPCMGEDNEYVLTELLGRSRDEYDQLVADKVLY